MLLILYLFKNLNKLMCVLLVSNITKKMIYYFFLFFLFYKILFCFIYSSYIKLIIDILSINY
jgi:hypothetical protein